MLNNDIKLDRRAVDPLVAPLIGEPAHGERPCFMTAPLCWLFDGVTYEGFRTAVRWRWGLVQATALYPGHEPAIRRQGATASAGAALAVDRDKFAALGGFDPLYLPGRLEDLDFAYRGYQAGYRAVYVPEATAWHRGMATFGRVYGSLGCDELALRNTLLFQWKNLCTRPTLPGKRPVCRCGWRWSGCGPLGRRRRRWRFARALMGAMARRRQQASGTPGTADLRREREFFRRFHPRGMSHV